MLCGRKPRSNKNGNCKTILERLFGAEQHASRCQMILEGLIDKLNNLTQLHRKIIPTWLHLKKDVDIRIPGRFL